MNFWSIITLGLVAFMLYDVKKQGGKTGKQIQKYVEDYFGPDLTGLTNQLDEYDPDTGSQDPADQNLDIQIDPDTSVYDEDGNLVIVAPSGSTATVISEDAVINIFYGYTQSGVRMYCQVNIAGNGISFVGWQWDNSKPYYGYGIFEAPAPVIDLMRDSGSFNLIRI